MATANEVLILFTTALGAPSDSEEQATLLGQVRAAIEKEPAFIPVLYSTILSVVPRGVGDILKRWIADTVEYVVARLGVATVNSLAPEQKVHRKCDHGLFSPQRRLRAGRQGSVFYVLAHSMKKRHG